MSRNLRIAADLVLPLEAVTQAIAIVAKRRAGKSYTARRFVEQLARLGQQVVIVDPKGDWWGIRSSADGKSVGLPITILGGERGDVPLEVGGGELAAKLAAEDGMSLLLDLSLFRKHEVATFMTAFLEALYRIKAREQFRTPMMLVLDEADAIAPQRPQKGEERMLGAAEDIVRRGGQRGIGCILITQRTAVLNKNVLTQAQVLVALRTIAPQDLAALDAWIQAHGTEAQKRTLLEVVPALPVGDAWFWSPGWPDAEGIFKRVHVLPIETFDSGATPRPGEKRREPKTVAEIDLEALRNQMAATIERAKADDPRELRKRIAELTKERDAALKVKPFRQPLVEIKRVEVPVISEAKIERLATEAARLVQRADELATTVAAWSELHKAKVAAFAKQQTAVLPTPPSPPRREVEIRRPPIRQLVARSTPTSTNGHADSSGVGEGAVRRLLSALAQFPAGLTSRRMCALAGVARKKSTYRIAMARMRQNSWIAGDDPYVITDEGLSSLGHYDPLPSGPERIEMWIQELGEGAASRLFREFVYAYPKALTPEEACEAAEVDRGASTYRIAMAKLRALDLVTGRGELRASEELFS